MTAPRATIAFALLLARAAFGGVATSPAAGPSSAPAATMPATTQAVDPQVAAWLDHLADDDVSARDAAQQKLLDVPDEATASLRAARAASRDPDVRLRLDTLLAERGERAMIGASRVTLQFTDARLPTVLAAFSKATGAQVDDNVTRDGQPGPRLTLDVRDASYWQALAAIADAGKIAFQPRGDRMLHVYRANQVGGGPTFHGVESGPFLFQAVSATYARSQTYLQGMGTAEPTFSFQIQVMTEPKLRLSDQAMRVDLRRAVDSAGNDLIQPNRNMGSNIYGNGNDAINVVLNLAYPKTPGERIAEISGTIHVPVATRTASIDVDDLLAAPSVTRELAGVRVEIRPTSNDAKDAANNNGFSHCEFVVTIGRDSAEPNGSDRLFRAFQRARVTDGGGRPLQLTNFSSNNDGQHVEVRLAFSSQGMRPGQSGGGPYQLHVDVPTAFRELDVPFAFHDLKMP